MYNKNGLFLINSAPALGSTYLSYSGNNAITFADGTKNGSVPVYTYYYSGSASFNTGFFCQARLLMSGLTTGNVSVSKPQTSYTYTTYFNLGYRASAFTEETYDYASSVAGMSYNIVATAGRVTVTAINSGSSDAIINELDVSITGGTVSSSSVSGGIIIAGFHFADVTIAPGESYTFTIMHKNS